MPNDPTTLPAGRELDALVLVKVCGWRWMLHNKAGLCAIHPPKGGDWKPVNWGPGIFKAFNGVPTDEQRFRDWDGSATAGRLGSNKMRLVIPAPSTDIADAFGVLKTWDGAWEVASFERERACRLLRHGMLMHQGFAGSVEVAICYALLAAANAKEGGGDGL